MSTKIITDNIDLSADTTALEIPTGTTGQRPGVSNLDFLVVAAGGGVFGYDSPGGGGGGGVRTSFGSQSGGASPPESQFTFDTTGATSYTVTVGAGVQKDNGEDSVFADITSLGGGYGGGGDGSGAPYNGATGGSGGGGTGGGSFAVGSGTTGQGFAGGNGLVALNSYPGGGGGGSGGLGQTAPNGNTLGNGGVGTIVNILPYGTAATINVGEVSGTDVYYGGGGGGQSFLTASGGGGTGGLGGGADSPNGSGNNYQNVNGTDNTGGGGSGAVYPVTGVYPRGGSGVVILRYSSDFALNKTGTLVEASGSPFTEGSEKISVFISGTGTVNFTGGSAAIEGILRENTTTGKMEIYTGTTGWRALQQTGQDVGITPSSNFNTILYNGTGSAQSLTVGFKPDLTWIKSYSGSQEWHALFDVVRGVPGNNIGTNSQNQQGTNTTTVTSFDTNGFSVGSDATWFVNKSGNSYVSWNWKAGGAAVTNNDGQIASQVSANTDAGFSIVTVSYGSTSGTNYTNTFGHGLNQRPDFVITKWYNGTSVWVNILPFIGTNSIINFASSSTPSVDTFFEATATTLKTGYSLGAHDVLCYCWHSVPGYSEIGYYIGTGVASGKKIYTGFKPAWLMVRNISTSKYWYIVDNKRSTTNPRNKELYPNAISNQATMDSVSFFDYGFEIVTTDSGYNTIGHQYIFMAFSE